MKVTLRKKKRTNKIAIVLVMGACIGTACAVAATLLKKERHKLLPQKETRRKCEKEKPNEDDKNAGPVIPEDFSPT